MDINSIQGISDAERISRQKHTGYGQAGFQNYLEKCTGNIKDLAKNKITSLPEVHPAPILNFENTGTKILSKADKIIDLLEKYSEVINNPNMNLKQIEPTLSKLKKEAEILNKSAGTENIDSGIKKIINDINVLASVEYFKFQRGDYI